MNTCSVCKHPNVENINAALAQGISVRVVETRFGISDTAAHRHRTNCIPAVVAKKKADAEELTAENLIRILQDV